MRILFVPNIHHTVGLNSAGYRFRAGNFAELLPTFGHEVVVAHTPELCKELPFQKRFDVVLYQKRFDTAENIDKIRNLNNGEVVIIYDLCDNYFCENNDVKDMCCDFIRLVDAVFVTNNFLAEEALKHGANYALKTPELLDVRTPRYKKHTEKKTIEALWHGNVGVPHSDPIHKGGLIDLLMLNDVLVNFLDWVHVHIVTGLDFSQQIPSDFFDILQQLRFSFSVEQWKSENVESFLYKPDITLIPAQRSDFTDGKSSNRVITSWINTIPCLVSPVFPYLELKEEQGLGKDHLFICNSPMEWREMISAYRCHKQRQLDGDFFRNLVEKNFSDGVLVRQWLDLVGEVIKHAGI